MVSPEQVEQVEGFGALELVTHFRTERGGDAAGFRTQQVPHWTLRWQGRPVVIDALGGLFGDRPQQQVRLNAVFVIEHAEGLPALLVNVGDANNTSSFHLVRRHGDALQVHLLCIAGAGDNAVGWAQQVQRRADGDAAVPARTAWLHGPLRETLSARPDDGGRYLQLGRRCLLDTRSGDVRWLPGDPEDASVLAWGPALVSPDGTRLARLGLAETAGADARPLLLVAEPMTLAADMVPGSVAAHQAARQGAGWQRIGVDRMRMRFPTLHAVDAAWVLHHFRWERGPQGERLAERRGFAPLPHRGVFADAHAEYRLEALREGLRQELVDFLVRRFDGRPVAGGASDFGVAVQVGAQTVTVNDAGFYIAQGGKPYFPGQPEDPQVQRAFVRRLGEAFDAELAGGRLDHLFAAAPR
ncbi:MAG: hypothetical protein KF683_14420 [Rubrivivax sp.]|nr:hypothetical protein [Rubrivivax sp.]